MLSDAVPLRLMVLLEEVNVEAEVGETMLRTGGVVSAAEEVTVSTAEATFPAASAAVTVICVDPLAKATPLIVQLVVPVAMPLAPRSVVQVTWVTPTLSDAVPPKLIVLPDEVKLPADVGEVMATVGGVASGT